MLIVETKLYLYMYVGLKQHGYQPVIIVYKTSDHPGAPASLKELCFVRAVLKDVMNV